MYIFLDESGQFTKHNHEEYFVVAAFTVGDPRRVERKFRSWCHTRFPKKMRVQSEIKWSARIDDRLRERTLQYIANLDVRIRYVYLLRTNIPIEYRRKEKIKSGALYANVIGELIDMFLPAGDMEFKLFCDQRHLEGGMTAIEFKQSMEARILAKVPNKALVRVEMLDSTSNANIQIADWIVGALARYHEHGHLGEEYFQILRNNLLNDGKEIFKHEKTYDEN